MTSNQSGITMLGKPNAAPGTDSYQLTAAYHTQLPLAIIKWAIVYVNAYVVVVAMLLQILDRPQLSDNTLFAISTVLAVVMKTSAPSDWLMTFRGFIQSVWLGM